ncbi:winged helix-turn-helix transcriptional regulator [Natrialba asiatica]|uniref:HxlR family transcriptional regulator n=1 Tax=Natrialba asiatica (strain ATCC 700177 / DSM 12278 / JCM 9576 / FERM P-10747 / NBRC 102637 / 172P1) TaxID=29540 RepID=M0B5T3_NATA1|nr:helix-turn-helix domain-containing protein [Natrialba asiatica]ELZ05887.1 HxlR family transcriptional regulator [Natrialba asiatica DSM 12278]
MNRSDETESPQTPEQSTAAPPDLDSHAVVEAHLDLLDDVPHIDETPEELHTTVCELLDLVTNAHAMAILYFLFCERRPVRFNELEDATGATPKVLSERLTELTDAELVSRHSYDEIPPHVEYEPTQKAKELDPAFQFLYAWAARYDLD